MAFASPPEFWRCARSIVPSPRSIPPAAAGWAKLFSHLHLPTGPIRLIPWLMALIALPMVFGYLLWFVRFLWQHAKNFWRTSDFTERMFLLSAGIVFSILIVFTYLCTQAFYGAHINGAWYNFDLIYSADSGYLVHTDVFRNIGADQKRSPSAPVRRVCHALCPGGLAGVEDSVFPAQRLCDGAPDHGHAALPHCHGAHCPDAGPWGLSKGAIPGVALRQLPGANLLPDRRAVFVCGVLPGAHALSPPGQGGRKPGLYRRYRFHADHGNFLPGHHLDRKFSNFVKNTLKLCGAFFAVMILSGQLTAFLDIPSYIEGYGYYTGVDVSLLSSSCSM